MNIILPPENKTVCRGSDVVLHCVYSGSTRALPLTWIINGTSFDQAAIKNSPSYQLNHVTTPSYRRVSLRVFSINATTTFQCVVHSTPNTTSTLGTVTVTTGMYVYIYIHIITGS